jgi:hypothetical protein
MLDSQPIGGYASTLGMTTPNGLSQEVRDAGLRATARRWRIRMLILHSVFLLWALVSQTGLVRGALGSHCLCLAQTLVGIPCPVCGATRSISSALHLDITGSLASHPLGPILALWLVATFSYFLLTFVYPWNSRVNLGTEVAIYSRGDTILGFLLVAVWLIRVILPAAKEAL